jgi:hypothetical protein
MQSAGVIYLADIRPGECTLSPSCYSARPLGSSPAVAYLVGPTSIEIDGDSSHTFMEADLTTSSSTALADYANFEATDPVDGDLYVLSLARPRVNGVLLTYTRLGIYGHFAASNKATIDFNLFAFGVLTKGRDMPRGGSASYSTYYSAAIYTNPGGPYYADNTTGSAAFTADFHDGAVSTSIDLDNARNSDPSGSPKSFGVLTGSGSIASGGPGFDGTFTNPGVSGEFDGAFFGPKAAEMGMAFHAVGSGFSVDGQVAGRKN